ncbi:hypothetical protein ACFW04_007005 [Cataglyphis niger]
MNKYHNYTYIVLFCTILSILFFSLSVYLLFCIPS